MIVTSHAPLPRSKDENCAFRTEPMADETGVSFAQGGVGQIQSGSSPVARR